MERSLGEEHRVVDDSRAPEPSAGLLIRFFYIVFRLLAYPLLALRRRRAAAAGSFVELEIDGHVPELPPQRTFLQRFRKKRGLSLYEMRLLAAEIKEDPKPSGLLLRLRSFEGGMATASAIRGILRGLVERGRRVVVHVPNGLDTKGYFLASGASEIYAFPGASLALTGFLSRGVFVKSALAKVGLVADVLARGKYKSAGDALSRDEMSEPQKEQVSAILDLHYVTLTLALRDGRKLSADEATTAVDRGIYRAPEAVTAKLFDGALFDDELHAKLAPSAKEGLYCAPAEPYLRARLAPLAKYASRSRGPCIGVIRVHGAISMGSLRGGPFPGRGAEGTAIIAATRAARESKRVRAVVLHVDSPGGSALASAQMHRELELLAAEKPLVVCMANVAASGGYYVAAPAHVIVASPVTITGSIGVIAARFALAPLLDRIGVHTDVLKRGVRADLFDPVHEPTTEERAALMAEIEGTYQEFLGVVARGRKKTMDEVEHLAQGRVWTGRDAHERGLVDVLGGFEEALAEARRRVGNGGEALLPREVVGKSREISLADAHPLQTELSLLASELFGEWGELVPLVRTSERVLVWEPSVMGLR